MEVDEPTYLKVNGPACTITPMDVLTYTRIMHKHTKAQFLASTTPAPASPAEINSSPPPSPTIKPAATKADPISFDSGSLHIPPPPTTAATSASATSNASSADASAGIIATTIITTTTKSTAAADHDDAQAHAAATSQHPAVYSSIHTGRTSGPMSALHRSLISASAPASAPLPTSHTPSPSSSPAAAALAPGTAHFDPAAVTARTTSAAVPTADAQHRRRSSAGLRKISAGLAKLGLWRGGGGGHHAADHQHQHQHQHHSQSDDHQHPQHWRQGPTAGHEGAEPGGDDEMDIDEVDGQPLAHLQCECGACDWCRLRRGVLKRNGLCNVGVGGPAGAAAGRRDTV
ncbi:uncharacterized protein BKA78DRAFT_129800 [Phyllosticta capitalensis]|uniref:uncharacterized protein n=1 Tax=Phyllosticta capitalensis TaxID=121624 RepID=UPI00312EEB59